MTPTEIANKLYQEADDLLYKRGVDTLLRKQGEVFYAGSYVLNLMAWPDIDLNLVVEEGKNPAQAASELATEFILWEESVRVKFERKMHLTNPGVPEGVYLGIKLDIGKWKLPWKLDIWMVDQKLCEETKKKTQEVQELLTDSSREKILFWKQKILTPEGRTPSFSGHWLCQAILVHQLTKEEEIFNFLREHGVKV